MKVIAHISDLHFGTQDKAVAAVLLRDLHAATPDLVVVSGDLTQRARSGQFRAAREYLSRLPQPQLVVPGNHDVPLFDVFSRFALKLRRYQAFITRELNPFWHCDGLVVLGLNTARSATWKEGRISARQMAMIRQRLCGLPDGTFRVLVTHHPFVPPPDDPQSRVVGRSRLALAELERCGVDLLLAGHLHRAYTGETRTHYVERKHSILVVQAGTAVSRRVRTEPNAYNLLEVEPASLTLQVRQWNGSEFLTSSVSRWQKIGNSWQLVRPQV